MLQEYVINICFCLHIYLILFTAVPNMHHDINMKNLSTFLKRTGLSKRLSTIVDEKKNCQQRVIHSPPTKSGLETPSKL